jgi:HSP20 family protein
MSKVRVQTLSSDQARNLPIFLEFAEIADLIRDRAYQLFEDRGFVEGYELEDWLMAEHQVCWPPAELVEESDEFEIKVALAGYEPDEISVTATPKEIIVKADHEPDEEDEDAITRFSEFRSNRVYRRFELPARIRADKVEAKFKNGLLKIEADKLAESQPEPKRIDIQTAA